MKGAQQRLLAHEGQPVQLRNYEKTESGGRQIWSETADSPHTVTALIDPATTPTPDRDVYDAGDINLTRSFHIKSGTAAVSNLRDGGGEGATELDYGGRTWLVLHREDPQTGLVELVCEPAP
jgi:hypothetical protein